jgi:hypothetical protein
MAPRFSLSLEVTCDNGFLAGFGALHGEGAVGLADDAVGGFHRRKHHTRTLRMQPNYWARCRGPAEALSDDPPRRVAAREVGPCVTLSLKFWAVDHLPPPCSEIDGAVIGRERSFHHAALVLADVVVHVLRRPLETIDNLSCPQPFGVRQVPMVVPGVPAAEKPIANLPAAYSRAWRSMAQIGAALPGRSSVPQAGLMPAYRRADSGRLPIHRGG